MVKTLLAVMTALVFSLGLTTIVAYGGVFDEEQEGAGTYGSSLKSGIVRASYLMDKTIKTSDGVELGEVHDVVISDGKVQYVILNREDRLIPVPFGTISSAKLGEDDIIVLNLDEAKLDRAPTFTEEEWNRLGDPSFDSQVFGYYGEGKMGEGAMEQHSLKSGIVRVSHLMDKTFKTRDGKELGDVHDVVISDGRLRYVVLEREDKLIPVPFDTISSAKLGEDDIIVLNLDEAKLDRAPTFTEEEWNRLGDPSFDSQVFGYYGESHPEKGMKDHPMMKRY